MRLVAPRTTKGLDLKAPSLPPCHEINKSSRFSSVPDANESMTRVQQKNDSRREINPNAMRTKPNQS